jgi:pentatricopeptide repeat protein
MNTAFGVGPDLTVMDPAEGLAIVEEAWPKIKVPEVKTGLLKTFAFSKALRPKKHAKLFRVLHLGMTTDHDPDVVAYAAAYLKEYAGKDFSRDPKAYSAWYAANKDKTPEEVLGIASSGEARGKLDGDNVERAEELAQAGWQLWKQRKFDDAANVFQRAAKLDPESANIWNGLGWARFNGGDSEAGIAAFEKCVELEPEHPAGLNGLGQAYLAQGDFKKAEKFLTKAAPQASAAWFGLARLYLLTGEYKKAKKWIEKASSQQPDDATMKAMLRAARAGKLPDDLRKQIEPVGKPGKSPAVQAAGTGWRQFNEGKMRSAERSFRRALAKDPENLAALNGLGFCLLNTGKASGAKQYFERCLKLEPDAAGPMNGLARCLKAEGKVDEAVAVWERMHKKYPGPNAAVYGLATTDAERKEFEKALPLYEELVKSQPDNEEFRKAKAGATAKEVEATER